MEKRCRLERAIDDNIKRRMGFVCCITKATSPNSECVIPLFHSNHSYANAPQCYVIRTLPVLFSNVGCINVYDSYTKSYFLPSKHGKKTFTIVYTSVSQAPGRGPIRGPGINYTGPQEVLLEFVILVF